MTHEYTYDVLDVESIVVQHLHSRTLIKEHVAHILRKHGWLLMACVPILLISRRWR